MTGKEKCEVLRSIRKEVARENSIKMTFRKCRHKECATGTCPMCEEELKKLSEELDKKRAAGEIVFFEDTNAKLLRKSQRGSKYKLVRRGDMIEFATLGLLQCPENDEPPTGEPKGESRGHTPPA